jgi:hypothetical protein
MAVIEVRVLSNLRPLWMFESGHQKLLDTGSPIQGPVLASLAMLALKGALRVAPGRSAPLCPLFAAQAPSLQPMAFDVPGRDGKAAASTEPESRPGMIANPASPFKRGHSGVALTAAHCNASEGIVRRGSKSADSG